jgi:hypothetical protein
MVSITDWRSWFRGVHICSINNIPITIDNIRSMIRDQCQKRKPSIILQMAKPLAPTMTEYGAPQLYLDQLNVITHHLVAIKQDCAESWEGFPVSE